MTQRATRRTVLRAGAAAATAGCAGCAAHAVATPAAPAASAATPAPVAYLDRLPLERPVPATASDGTPLLLVRTGPGEVSGLDARCPHNGCVVKLLGDELACPCHNSRFVPTTGQRISGLAPTGLAPFPVRVDPDGAVLA